MKKFYLMKSMKSPVIWVIALLLSGYSLRAQQPRVFYLEIEPDQQVERVSGAAGPSVNVPVKSGIVVLDGAYDSEGLGQAIVFNGSRLIIDSMSMGQDGWRYIVLRREDGRDFFDMFPTLRARMIPTTQRPEPEENKDTISNN